MTSRSEIRHITPPTNSPTVVAIGVPLWMGVVEELGAELRVVGGVAVAETLEEAKGLWMTRGGPFTHWW